VRRVRSRLGLRSVALVAVIISVIVPAVLAAAVTSAPLVAQILDPTPGYKLRPGQTLDVRIRVGGGDPNSLSWVLSLRRERAAETVPLASGMGAIADVVVGELTALQLSAGEVHSLILAVDDASATAIGETAFLVVDSLYTLIPLEDGNYSRYRLATSGGDASGDLILYSPTYGDQVDIVVLERKTGRRDAVVISSASNEGIKLSDDGSRLFYSGWFPGAPPAGISTIGLGYLDLSARTFTRIGIDANFFCSTDRHGKRVAYQALAADRTLQYFFYDEASGETRQLTDDPNAIDKYYSRCPSQFGTTPLISADGATAVLITSATLGLVPEDESAGCRIFSYDVGARSFRLVASLPRSTNLGASYLSGDGRWLSFAPIRDLPNGGRRSFPALMDLQTGELRDPVVDVGDFTSFDSVITRDGRGMVISTQADLDPRVGNADHNMELFYYDFGTETFAQITETTGGIGRTPGGCPSYRPHVSQEGGVVVIGGFHRFSVEGCQLDSPQRNEGNGFWHRVLRAVRKRPGNQGPIFEKVSDQRVTAGETVTLEFSARDPDGEPISFFAQAKDGFDVPPGSEITDHHDGTATFRWRTRAEHVGDHVLRVAAFDEGGGEVFHDITISVVARSSGNRTATPTETATPAPPTPTTACIGDCNSDGQVSIEELITAVGITLDRSLLSTCPALACNGTAGVDCLLRAVGAALNGCPFGSAAR
jgi:hypothetical protein